MSCLNAGLAPFTYVAKIPTSMSKAEIAKLLDHEQEATTEIYVETDVDMIRDSLKQISKEDQEDIYASLSPDERKRVEGQS